MNPPTANNALGDPSAANPPFPASEQRILSGLVAQYLVKVATLERELDRLNREYWSDAAMHVMQRGTIAVILRLFGVPLAHMAGVPPSVPQTFSILNLGFGINGFGAVAITRDKMTVGLASEVISALKTLAVVERELKKKGENEIAVDILKTVDELNKELHTIEEKCRHAAVRLGLIPYGLISLGQQRIYRIDKRRWEREIQLKGMLVGPSW